MADRIFGIKTKLNVLQRRLIVIVVVAAITILACASVFLIAARKKITLEVDGQKRVVTTYAASLPQFLAAEHIQLKTHDQAVSSSGPWLANNATVHVRRAYQVTLNVDGHLIPYWTLANSAAQLDSYFASSQASAIKVTVQIPNIFNKYSGSLLVTQSGPVTVNAFGKIFTVPNGDQPVASILDSIGIPISTNDRISVLHQDQKTVLLVQKVNYREYKRTVPIPFTTATADDPDLATGQTQIRQKGQDGVRQETIKVTELDGKIEAQTIINSQVIKEPVTQIITRGTKGTYPPRNTNNNESNKESHTPQSPGTTAPATPAPAPSSSDTTTSTTTPKPSQPRPSRPLSPRPAPAPPSRDTQQSGSSSGRTQPRPAPTPAPAPTQRQTPAPAPIISNGQLSPAEAQVVARGMMQDLYGWKGDQFGCLVNLWNRESGWRWNSSNRWSGAYGIPQALPGSKMASAGADWRTNAATQIKWGLGYISARYGSPCGAWQFFRSHNWY